MTREIPLSRGLVALIDDADFEIVHAVGKWYANPSDRTFYARKNFWVDGHCHSVRMHTLITGWDYVDHINGNGLDNRRGNLRPANDALNSRNRQRRSDNKSGFKGVHLHKGSGRWQANVNVDGRRLYLGLHNTAEAAARAYDEAARCAFGSFARLNFPTPEQEVKP